MRILYGVTGEGMGHAIRSRVLLEHLVAQGHDVAVVASGKALRFLERRFDNVHPIHGLHMIFDGNRVDVKKTLLSNLVNGLRGIPRNVAKYFDLLRDFRPEVAISDFESWAYLYGQSHRLPILSIDNMQILDRCAVPDVVKTGCEAMFEMTRTFIASKLPACRDYFITTFFRPPLRKERTHLFPPILRPEILSAAPTRGDHLVVYQSAEGHDELTEILQHTDVECRLYGELRRDREEVFGNVRRMPFSEDAFIHDLASCRGVIAGGGFTLMGEALYLGKPMLSIPIEGQVEQLLNARYLELEGYGRHALHLDGRVLRDFVDALPELEDNAASYRQQGNREILDGLDGWLDRAAAGLA
ncbi:MAG: teichoic acid biosynthesis protein [Deltaproteobacteria bacterium]|nr:teichoic acid biosynthesis protein [Deltaproteobacteria bacterium]